MVVKKNGWVKLVSICLMLSLVLGFGGLIVPGAAGAAEISVTVTGDGGDDQVSAVPVLTADTTDNIIGQPVDITFSDEGDWSAAISSIIVDGIDLGTEQYTVSSDKLTLAPEVFTKTGDYEVLVKAIGYADAGVTQTMEAAILTELPDLSDDITDSEVDENLEQVSDDSSELIISTEGETEEEPIKLMGDEEPGLVPPALTPDTTDNIIGQPVEITFSDDGGWSVAITGIIVNSKVLGAEQYKIIGDKITLATGVFTNVGNFQVVVKATDYADASVTQTIEKFVMVTGDGVTSPTIFTMSDLAGMEQVSQCLYSTINTWPTKKWYIAEGPRLSELLTRAGIKAEAKSIKIISTDTFTKLLTREQLDAPRYYYPGLKENHEYFGYILGSPEGAAPVDTILALRSANSTNPDHMSSTEAPLLVMGQRWITEQTNELFVKYVGTIEVSTATPAKWENPVADKESGTVPAGTKVALSTSDMDGDSIHYTTDSTDPTIKSPMYNWIKKRWWGSRSDELETINHKIDINRSMTLKAIAIGPGRTDSDIVTFDYYVSDAYPPTLIRDTTNVCVDQPIEITFSDDQEWVDAIKEIKVDNTVLSQEKYTATANKITFAAGVFTEAKDYTITISAEDFRDAIVVQKMVLENADPPSLVADETNNMIGQAIKLTFLGDEDWQAAITKVSVDDTELTNMQYAVGFGTITISADILNEAKDYNIVVQAIGYYDATIVKTMKKAPPVLAASITDYEVSEPIEITFTDDEDWREAITIVSVGDTELTNEQYKIESGKITISAGILNEVRDYSITVQANGYVDAKVIKTIWPGGNVPPVLVADTTDNAIGQPLEISFADDANWRAAVTKVSVGDTELANGKYKIESGKITIPENVLSVGDHTIIINASGYKNAVVVQPVVDIPPVLSPQTVNNGVNSKIVITYPANSTYKNAVSAIFVDGNLLPAANYSTFLNGKITINDGVLSEMKDYNIVVQAQGYLDAAVVQTMKKAAPTLTAPYGYIGKAIQLTFTDDTTWREAVTEVSVDGELLQPKNYTLEAGKITFPPGVLNDVRNYANPYIIVISAKDGFADTSVELKVASGIAPKLTPDTSDNMVGQLIELTFTDDPYWRSVITEVKVDNVTIASEKYTLEAGKLTIRPGVFTQIKLYNVSVQATGYNISSISQTVLIGGSPVLTPDVTDNNVGYPIELTFTDASWKNAITEVRVNDSKIASDKYSLGADKLTIDASMFTEAGTYTIVVKATAYSDAELEQLIREAKQPQYKVTPAEDAVYTIGTITDGIKTMTVNPDQNGFKYFNVSVEPVTAHAGTEAAVFTHLRNDIQLEINAAVADFDVINTAKAGFNVNPGDVIKVYIVDQLTNDSDLNPVILQ